MRLPDDPQPGLVLCYSYLWADEGRQGRTEGIKDRPAVVVLARRDLGPARLIYVAPVSHADTAGADTSVEIPAIVKRHLGLDDAASFIKTTELNIFVWPGPDLRPVRRLREPSDDPPCYYGYLPRGLFRRLSTARSLPVATAIDRPQPALGSGPKRQAVNVRLRPTLARAISASASAGSIRPS